jgi:hypothetical protein
MCRAGFAPRQDKIYVKCLINPNDERELYTLVEDYIECRAQGCVNEPKRELLTQYYLPELTTAGVRTGNWLDSKIDHFIPPGTRYVMVESMYTNAPDPLNDGSVLHPNRLEHNLIWHAGRG